MADIAMTIGGVSASTKSTFPVLNPATEAVYAEAPECTEAQLDEAMEAAAEAQRDWSRDEKARIVAMHAAADAVDAAADEIGHILTSEQGKPLRSAIGETHFFASRMRWYADLELPEEVIQDDDHAHIEILRRPLGVVAAITPWNVPLIMAAFKIAPAIRAGNTVVLKPSPFTPLSTLKLGEVMQAALPAGVVNIVSGGNDLGALMTKHPIPRKLTFTGSVATGKQVALAGAADLKRVTLELGGNDPAIVLDDADLDSAINKIFWSAFGNSGQVCIATKRVYVPERLYADVVDGLAEKARMVRVGNGMDEQTELGPLNNSPQYARVSELVDDAVHHGARSAAGGHKMDGPGYFYEPTVLADLSDGTRIVDEEQFGPALPVISYRDVDDVIARANAGHFGLGGSVWSTDIQRAAEVAGRLDCGTSWINTHGALVPDQPIGGHKWSGIGLEAGPLGYYAYTEVQVVHRAVG